MLKKDWINKVSYLEAKLRASSKASKKILLLANKTRDDEIEELKQKLDSTEIAHGLMSGLYADASADVSRFSEKNHDLESEIFSLKEKRNDFHREIESLEFSLKDLVESRQEVADAIRFFVRVHFPESDLDYEAKAGEPSFLSFCRVILKMAYGD